VAETKAKPKRRTKPTEAAAEKEQGTEAKTIEWRGHTLKLPATPPRSIGFRVAEVEEAGDDVRPLLKLLKSILDVAEAGQYGRIAREIDQASDDEADEVLGSAYQLVWDIIPILYGVDAGESEASQDS
jgi:hypothetical protein